MSAPVQKNLSMAFNSSAANAQEQESKPDTEKPSRITIRFTANERAQLEAKAGNTALSAYIREQLFNDEAAASPRRRVKKPRSVEADITRVAQLLGSLGQSEMTQVLFGLLLAAEAGKAELPDEHLEHLHQACGHIEEMRDMLVVALGVKPQSRSRL